MYTNSIKTYFGLFTILIVFILLAVGYSFITPLWNPPDEERHFAYCEYIAQHHQLPPYSTDADKNPVSMAFHPPLYYMIGSLWCKDDGNLLEEEITFNDGPGYNFITHPNDSADSPYAGKAKSAYLIRLFSILLQAMNICCIYFIALIIFPGELIFAISTALFVAAIPQFLHVSASVSNDNMAIAFSTAYLLALLFYLKNKSSFSARLLCGVLLGFSLLSKSSALFLLPVTVCALWLIFARDRKKMIFDIAIIFGAAFFISGWWYIRNWVMLGDPLLSRTLETVQPWIMRIRPLSFSNVGVIAGRTFSSFFGDFGALQIAISPFHLSLYGAVFLGGLFGFLRFIAGRDLTQFQRQASIVLLTTLLGGAVFFLWINIKYDGVYLGRYLFPILGPIAIIIYTGLRTLFPLRLRKGIFIALSVVLIMLNLYVLFSVLKPAYKKTRLTPGIQQQMFCCPSVAINRKNTLGQIFLSSQDNLCAIRVMFSCTNRQNNGELIFKLTEAEGSGKIIRQIHYPLKKIRDFNRYFFIFPPVKNSSGKKYIFSFTSTVSPVKKGIALWQAKKDLYPQGTLLINGKPACGDLYFSVYSFNGRIPETKWERKTATVIRQGPFVHMRELQLYHERTKSFREKTLTHKKMLLSLRAKAYRKKAGLLSPQPNPTHGTF